MGMPSKLINFATFIDGVGYAGQVAEVVLPKLKRKMEEWRGGGMNGPIKADFGMEGLSIEQTYGGIMRPILEQWGVLRHDGVQVRFAGAYKSADKDTVDAVEVVIRGRHEEIDMGTAKVADDTAFKVNTTLSYYKLTINGQEVIEIDFVNLVEKINGKDLQADVRKAIGL